MSHPKNGFRSRWFAVPDQRISAPRRPKTCILVKYIPLAGSFQTGHICCAERGISYRRMSPNIAGNVILTCPKVLFVASLYRIWGLFIAGMFVFAGIGCDRELLSLAKQSSIT